MRASQKIFYDASFSNRVLSRNLLSRFSVRAPCGILHMDFVAKKCSSPGLMPKRSRMANIIEDLVSMPEVATLLQTLIENARKRAEWETVRIDATYKITTSALG